MACSHTASLTASSKVDGPSICENRGKNENEFVVSSVYNLRRLIFFVCNILAKFGSEDVELLKLLVGVCCTLGVDCAHVVLTGVLYAVICIIVRGVDGLRTNLGMMFEPLNLMYRHAPLRQ
jgi:hypothetical protein